MKTETLSLIAVIVSVLGLLVTLVRESRKDASAKTAIEGGLALVTQQLQLGLAGVKEQIDQLRADHRDRNDEADAMKDRIASLEGVARDLAHRIEALAAASAACRPDCQRMSLDLARVQEQILYLTRRVDSSRSQSQQIPATK